MGAHELSEDTVAVIKRVSRQSSLAGLHELTQSTLRRQPVAWPADPQPARAVSAEPSR